MLDTTGGDCGKGFLRHSIHQKSGRLDPILFETPSLLDDINKAIENAGTLEVYELEKNVSVLATVAGAAPMIGFLGTVIGMILAFHQMATSGGQAEMGALASGIYTAMTTTVAGLVVGIIAYVGYNHLVNRTDKVIHQMEANAVEFLDLLSEPV